MKTIEGCRSHIEQYIPLVLYTLNNKFPLKFAYCFHSAFHSILNIRRKDEGDIHTVQDHPLKITRVKGGVYASLI